MSDCFKVQSGQKMGKKGDLSDFEHDMDVSARQAGGLLSSETADLMVFMCISTVSLFFTAARANI